MIKLPESIRDIKDSYTDYRNNLPATVTGKQPSVPLLKKSVGGALFGLAMAGGVTALTVLAGREYAALAAKPLVDASVGEIVQAGGYVAGAMVGGAEAVANLVFAKKNLSADSPTPEMSRTAEIVANGAVSLIGLVGGVLGGKEAVVLSDKSVVTATIGDLIKAGGCVAGASIGGLVFIGILMNAAQNQRSVNSPGDVEVGALINLDHPIPNKVSRGL